MHNEKTIPVHLVEEPATAQYSNPQTSFPQAWVFVEISKNVNTKKPVTKKLFAQDVVVYRSESGKVAVIDPHCPHFGAHFGHGGTVNGELLECPFHGFKFNSEGQCTNSSAKHCLAEDKTVYHYPTIERDGYIFCYYDAEKKQPDWQIPTFELEGYVQLLSPFQQSSPGHPWEHIVNNIDYLHFKKIHKTTQFPEVIQEPSIDGHRVEACVIATQGNTRYKLRSQYLGLGILNQDFQLLNFDIKAKFLTFFSPTDKNTLNISTHIYVQASKSKILPYAFLVNLLKSVFYKMIIMNNRDEYRVMKNKYYYNFGEHGLTQGEDHIKDIEAWAQNYYALSGVEK
ncbi:MAG: Rieske (2Fe-2S) protein [Pseudomonadales bacterium]|nr:Rieske (2Fe-2S) protein [Pseudomonadales bacterium]